MTTLATLLVRLTADTAQFESKMKAVQQIGDKMSSVGKKLTATVSAPLAAVGVLSIKAASDMGEALNKVQVVFGDSSKVIEDFAGSAAKNLGLSKRAALEASGTLGNLFVTMGLGTRASADMSVGLVKLAADLGSFNNLGTEDVLEKLRSGLVGQSEPLRALGINLSEATVKTKAMELGLADATGQVSQAGLVQARYALILEQTKTAQGDFARTANGLANSMKTAKAKLEDTASALGEKLIPYAIRAVEWLGKMADAFGNLSPGTQDSIVAIGALAVAAGPATMALGNMIKVGAGVVIALKGIPALIGLVRAAALNFGGASALTTALTASFGTLAVTVGAVVAVFGSLVGVYLAWKNVNNQVEQGVKKVDDAWGNFFDTQIGQGKSAMEITQAYIEKTKAADAAFRGSGKGMDLLITKYLQLTTEEQKYLRNAGGLKSALMKSAETFEDYSAAVQAAGLQVWAQEIIQWNAINATNTQATSVSASENATRAYAESINMLGETLSMNENVLNAYTGNVAALQTTFSASEHSAYAMGNTVTASTNDMYWAQFEYNQAMERTAQIMNDDLPSAMQNLSAAEQSWMMGTANDIGSKLEQAGIKGTDYKLALEAIDGIYGSDLAERQAYQETLAAIVADYKKSGDIDKFKTAIGGLKDSFMPLATDVEKARLKVKDLKDELASLKGVRIPVIIDVQYPNGQPSTGGGGSAPTPRKNGGAIENANGGAYWVTSPTLFMAGEA
ncbi:MAG: hypothetical protein EHM48_04620, partial [Planctomycetaceae bacterium]